MPDLEFLAQPFFQHLTTALLHFLWQGLLIAAVVWLLLSRLRPRTAQARYGMLLAAFLALPLCPLVTFWQLKSHAVHAIPELPRAGGAEFESGQPPSAAADRGPQVASDAAWSSAARLVGATIQPYALAAWMLGVLLFGVRLLLGVGGVASLRRRYETVAPAVAERAVRLSQKLKLATVPRVVGSRHVGEALATGLWRPMVLLPLSWLSEAPPDVLDAVIAHELAHIRRRDLWVNAFQRVTETLLFYHPAVWWISGRLTQEREMCCDRLAVSVTGERVGYARALEFVARKKSSGRNLVLTAGFGGNKMAVLKRVRHVLEPDNRDAGGSWWSAGLIFVTVPVLMWLAVPSTSADTPDENRPEREAAAEDSAERERPRESEGTGDRDRRERGERGGQVDRERHEPAEARDRAQPRETELVWQRESALQEIDALRHAIHELQDEVRRLRGRRPESSAGRPEPEVAEPGRRPTLEKPHGVDLQLGRFSILLGRHVGPDHRTDETRQRNGESDDPPEGTGRLMFGTGVNSDAGVTGTIVLGESDLRISVESDAHKPTEPSRNRRHIVHNVHIGRHEQPEADRLREERNEDKHTDRDRQPGDPRPLLPPTSPRPPQPPRDNPLSTGQPQPPRDNPFSRRQPDGPRPVLRDRGKAPSGEVMEMIEQLRREVEDLRREIRRRDESDKEVREPRPTY